MPQRLIPPREVLAVKLRLVHVTVGINTRGHDRGRHYDGHVLGYDGRGAERQGDRATLGPG